MQQGCQQNRMSIYSNTTSVVIPFCCQLTPFFHQKRSWIPRALIWGIVCFVLLLAGCGPEKSSSNEEQRVQETQRIALDYLGHTDVRRAQSELEKLEVANTNQWLLYVTELSIESEPDQNKVIALVRLSTDMGLNSNMIQQYAQAHNLAPTAVALNSPAVNEQALATTPPVQTLAASTSLTPAGSNTQAAVGNPTLVTQAVSVTAIVQSPNTVAITATATLTIIAPVALPAPTNTPESAIVRAGSNINVRGGPGTDYTVVGALATGQSAQILAKNPEADWWNILLSTGQSGWVYSSLVETAGPLGAVAVAANIPPPPPTPTAAPVAVAPAVEQPTAITAPAAPPPAPSSSDKPYFRLVKKRMWGKDENDGCRGKHLLRIHVFDANGNRLNGVALEGIYTHEIIVTGSQGKGDGVIEYDLYNSGEGFVVIRDADGRDAASDRGEGFTTRSVDIDETTLINAGYCTDHETCQIFYNSWGCQGHHSWEAEFVRNY